MRLAVGANDIGWIGLGARKAGIIQERGFGVKYDAFVSKLA